MFRDPIVEEVRATRERLAARYDFDLRRIVEAAQEQQKHSHAEVVSFANEPDDDDDIVNNLIQHSPEFQAFLARRAEEDKKRQPISIEEVRKRLLGE